MSGYSRYQVKFKRRRAGKTDYYQRKRLISQDKDRYNVRKYRLAVRSTNKYIIAQISYATISGDIIVCQANSKELTKYGIKLGLNNYAAAYATGLLIARRHLAKLKLDKKHVGLTGGSVGEDFNNQDEVEGNRSFKCVLDIGLARSTTGAKVFGVMKGALDGGLNIPHDPKRFVGNLKENKEYKPEVHREHIYGLHVANYMKHLEQNDQEAFKRQFSDYIKHNIKADDLEVIYKKAHELIRANPEANPKTRTVKEKKVQTPAETKKLARKKIVDRRIRIAHKKAKFMAEIKATA